MPRRELLETGHYYHLYNRSPHGLKIFSNKQCAIEFEHALLYYVQANPPAKFALRDKLKKIQDDYSRLLVTISAYCIMPTHFHILVRQEVDRGIATYMQRLQNSFSHYYNRLYDSHGSLFQGRYQAKEVSIHTSRLYLSRYIHLNPLTAKLVNKLALYPYSSYKLYAHNTFPPGVDPKPVLGRHLNHREYLNYLKQPVNQIQPAPLIDEPGA